MASQPINLPSIYKTLTAPAGTNPSDAAMAQSQMAMTYAPQEMAIGNTINQIQNYLDQSVNQQQQYGNVADQKIGEVGAALANQLTGNAQAIGKTAAANQAQQGSIYDQASQAVDAAGQSIRDRISNAAATLGQTQALKADPFGTDPISRLMADQAFTQNQLNTGRATALSAAGNLGSALQNIAQKAVGDTQSEYAQRRADLATQVLGEISNLNLQGSRDIGQQLQNYAALAATEAPAFTNAVYQAGMNRYQMERQAQLDASLMALQGAQGEYYRGRGEAALENAQASSDPNSLDNIYKSLQIQDLANKINPSSQYLSAGEGNAQLMDWLNNLRVNEKALTGTQYAGIQNFINKESGAASAMNADPYAYLVAQAQAGTNNGMVNLPVTQGSKYGQKDYTVPIQTLLDAIGERYIGAATTGAKVGSAKK